MPASRACNGGLVAFRYVSRRWLLGAAGSAAATSVLPFPHIRAAPKEILFGLTPVFLTNDLELLTRLKGYFSRVTGREVRLVQRRTYQEITTLLLSGQIDAAWICGYPFIRYRDRLELLAVPSWRGQPLYQSYLIVSPGRVAKTIEDLRGDIHAFSDPDSNSGYLVTTALIAERGERPSGFFSRTFYTYGHRNVVRAVSSGLAHSGSVDGYVWEVMRETEPELTARTRILRKSEWLGFPPVAAAAEPRDADAVRRITAALERMADDQEGRTILKMLRLDRFEKRGPEIFDLIGEKVSQVQRLG